MSNIPKKTPPVSWASHLFHREIDSMRNPPNWMITDKTIALTTLQEMRTIQKHNNTDDAIIWDRIDPSIQIDCDVAIAAVLAQCFPNRFHKWPATLQYDHRFWNELLSYQGDLQDNAARDNELFTSRASTTITTKTCASSQYKLIPDWKSTEQIHSVLNQLPMLRSNIPFWYTTVQSGHASENLLIKYADSEIILNNKSFIIDAIRENYKVYDALCAPLNQDEDIVTVTLQANVMAIILIPAFIQNMYPDAVIQAIRNSKDYHSEQLPIVRPYRFAEYMSQELWNNREVLLAWASIGGEYRPDDFLPEFRYDTELFLVYARTNPSQFQYASKSLRNNKEYLKHVLEICSDSFFSGDISEDLQYDYDLALIAFSTPEKDSNVIRFLNSDEYLFYQKFLCSVDQKLQEHNNFLNVVWAVTSGASSYLDNHGQIDDNVQLSQLPLLNHGNETTAVLLKLIREYIGAPHGIELQRLYRARKNVLRQIFYA